MTHNIARGSIYYADLSPVIGSEQGGIRPVVIIQNNTGNRFSPTVIVASVTSQVNKPDLPMHVKLYNKYGSIDAGSIILLEQIRTLDKCRLRERICKLDADDIALLNNALKVSLSLD